MDQAAASLLFMEAMGSKRIPGVDQARGQQGSCMEHGEISPRSLASEPKPGVGFCINGQVFCRVGITETAC